MSPNVTIGRHTSLGRALRAPHDRSRTSLRVNRSKEHGAGRTIIYSTGSIRQRVAASAKLAPRPIWSRRVSPPPGSISLPHPVHPIPCLRRCSKRTPRVGECVSWLGVQSSEHGEGHLHPPCCVSTLHPRLPFRCLLSVVVECCCCCIISSGYTFGLNIDISCKLEVALSFHATPSSKRRHRSARGCPC